MTCRFAASCVSLVAAFPVAALTQPPAGAAPLQAGVSVQMATTRNAVAVPRADAPEAVVVALTSDGTVYLGGERLTAAALPKRVGLALASQTEKTLYVKADARVAYARVVEVLDALQASGMDGVTLLTTQREPADGPARRVPPRGLELAVRTR